MKNMSARARNSLKCVAIILSVILCGGGCFLALFLRSRAIYTTDTTSYVKVNEIYDDSAGAMNPDNVNTLLRYITGDADITIDTATDTLNTMATANTTSADIATKAVLDKANGDDIIVTFGGLDWQVVYLSKDTDGNNILTLWLANSTDTSTWSNGWYEKNSSYANPSNMYGSSYIRCVTLNAGGTYSTSSSGTASATQTETNKFARFTMEEVDNSLIQYLITPSKVNWQLYQSAIKEIGFIYLCPNESIEDPRPTLGGDYRYYDANKYYDYHGKALYTAWENDYIWLPSLAETGYSTSVNGLWETSTEQRQNVSSSGVRSWLRSGIYSSAHNAYSLNRSGSDDDNSALHSSLAVRPALHLNLSKVIKDVLGVQEIVLNNQGGEGASGMYISGEGFFADEALKEPITKVEVPTKAGYVFEGYYTSADGGVQMIEADGTILGSALDYQNITTLFAVWSEGNLAKYDSVGGYWYVENGKMPQSRVNDEATIEALNTSTLSGDVYEFAGMRFGSVKLSGSENEYFKFDDKWYKVEPIRWRLVYSSAQTSGYGTTEATMAILAEIVYVDAYSDAKLMGGAGYSAESVAPFMTNHINEDKFVTETRTVDLFSETAGSSTTTVSGDVFVASKEEINLFKTTANGTGETVNVGFSDLVSDYLASLGKGEHYFTRSLGNQLNNFHCLSPVGASTQIKAQQAYGIMFSTKVKGYGCQ